MSQKFNIFTKIFRKDSLLNKKGFINALLKKMRKESRYPSPQYNEMTDYILWGENEFYMGNIYEDYSRSEPQNAEQFISTTFERFKITMNARGEDDILPFEEIVSILLPSIRSRLFLESMQQDEELPFRLMNDFVGVCISLETEISIMLPKQRYFEEWGKDFDEVFNYAIQNLEAVNEGGYEDIFPGVWRSMWKDGYDPSRILHTDRLWDRDIKGDPVLFIPHREVLLVTGSEDEEGLEFAIDFCEDYRGLNYSISGFPFMPVERENGQYSLELFSVPEDHSLYEKIKSLIMSSLEREALPVNAILKERRAEFEDN